MMRPRHENMHRSVNGVDVDRLQETVQAIKSEPSLGEFRFRARNHWLGGSQNHTEVKDFYGAGKEDTARTRPFELDCDEPPILLGRDAAPNPVEHLLNALAGCITTTMAMHAAARGIDIHSIDSELEGDIDIRGFLGLTDDVPRGFKNIRVTMHIQSDAPPEKLRELAQFSPVFSTVTNPVPVDINIQPA